jgi:NAD(P)-dependent dehydrogenase (short-subunit alcohol dehydrogenase family)
MPTALITGSSAGLGRALAAALAARGWDLVLTARGHSALADVSRTLTARTSPGGAAVHAVAGDVADPGHRAELVRQIRRRGNLDLLVNNASTLGPTPLRPLSDWQPDELDDVLRVNFTGPFALTSALLPALAAARGTVLSISSDAAVEHYPGWGGYGASKAALDHLTLTFGVENLDIACYAVDPGDMQTAMQQAAFPGEDISDRRRPEEVVPILLDLITARPGSGRYRVDGHRAVPDRTPETDGLTTAVPAR